MSRPRTKIELISNIIASVREFKFCGPSDDLDEQTAVTVGFRHLVIQLQRLAAPLLSEPEKQRLLDIDVEVNNIFSVYEASAEVEALLYDIESALNRYDETTADVDANLYIIQPTVIERLQAVPSKRFNTSFLVRLCKEINSCFANGNIVATALTMRTVLNYVPPAFGRASFKEVASHSERSHKASFVHLEDGLRRVADSLGHGTIANSSVYPSASQVEPYKPQFEMLLNRVYDLLTSRDIQIKVSQPVDS